MGSMNSSKVIAGGRGRHRVRATVLVAVAAVGLLATACSAGVRDATREQERTARNASVSSGYTIDEWCPNADWGSFTVSRITVCTVLENRTRRFTAPDQAPIAATVPLILVRALCSSSTSPCVSTSDYYGAVRPDSWTQSGPNADRNLQPNPIVDTSYMQFMPNKIFQGVTVGLVLAADSAPFNRDEQGPQTYFTTPDNGAWNAYSRCERQGTWIGCEEAGGWSYADYNPRPKYVLFNRTMRIRVVNQTENDLVELHSWSAGRGFKVDPKAISGISLLKAKSTGYLGGYLTTSGSGAAESWTASYCIAPTKSDPNSTTTSTTIDLASCTRADISVLVKAQDGSDVNESSCQISNMTFATFRCEKPAVSGTPEDRIVTINVRS